VRGLGFGLAALGAAAALACGGSDPVEPIPSYTVVSLAKAPLSAPAGSELPAPLQVEVRDPDGTPVRGVAVRFQIVTGRGASLTDTLVATSPEGIGSTRLRLGPSRDSVVVAGSVRGQEDRGVTFRIFPGAPPELLTIDPSVFAAGDTLLLRGNRLLAGSAGDDVFFGSARGRVVGQPSDSLVRVIVPPCLAVGNLAVSVRVGTATTNPVVGTAVSRGAPLALAVGEGLAVRGADAGCVRLATAGQRFILVPQFATYADSVPSTRPFTLSVDALSPVASAGDSGGPTPTGGTVTARTAFELMLRSTEQQIARTLSRPASERALEPGAPALDRARLAQAPVPALGSTRSFHVLTRLDGTTFGTATARLRYMGTNILVYEDLTAPAPLGDSTVAALGDLFDRTLYPIDVQTFGSESDVDGNGRVIVLLTPLVNGLTPASQCATAAYVPGYFYGIDLDTRNKNSNRAEIFYAFVPDPKGERSCPHTLDDVLGLLPATFLHEFQHMISFNQHVLVRGGPVEAIWLNEGMSHIAEELGARHFDAQFPAPAGRSQPSQLLPDSALPFVRGDLDNASLYLGSTPSHSVTAFQNLGTLEERGAAWLFLRWLGAQKGDAVYARLEQTGLRSGQNVESAAGETFTALFGDFTLALYADSIPGLARSAVSPRLRMGPRPLRELMTRGLGRTSYPLTVRSAPPPGFPTSGTMVQGTALYYQLTVPAGGVAVRYSAPNGTALSAALVPQLGVLRITP
jgi:hypothetical protein